MKNPKRRKLQIRIVLVLSALIISYVCHGLFSDKMAVWDSRVRVQIKDHIDGENQFDDITIMALRRGKYRR